LTSSLQAPVQPTRYRHGLMLSSWAAASCFQ
jgi:hypothetical protein